MEWKETAKELPRLQKSRLWGSNDYLLVSNGQHNQTNGVVRSGEFRLIEGFNTSDTAWYSNGNQINRPKFWCYIPEPPYLEENGEIRT